MSDRTAGFPTDIKVQGGLRQNHATTLYILGGEHMVEGKREPVLGYRLIQEINYIPF